MLNLAGPFEFAPANHSLQELKSEGGPAEGGPGTSRKPESIRPVGLAAYAQLDICSELQLIDYSYPSKYLARPPPAVVLLPDVAMAGTFANAKGGADCHVAGLKMTYFEAMVLPSRVWGGKDLPGGLSTDIVRPLTICLRSRTVQESRRQQLRQWTCHQTSGWHTMGRRSIATGLCTKLMTRVLQRAEQTTSVNTRAMQCSSRTYTKDILFLPWPKTKKSGGEHKRIDRPCWLTGPVQKPKQVVLPIPELLMSRGSLIWSRSA